MGLIPPNERQARELARLTPEQQRDVADEVDFQQVTAVQLKTIVAAKKKEKAPTSSGSQTNILRANETRSARIAELKKVCLHGWSISLSR